MFYQGSLLLSKPEIILYFYKMAKTFLPRAKGNNEHNTAVTNAQKHDRIPFLSQ